MKKIFKYRYDPESMIVSMPSVAHIIRIDHVDDGFYKGDFVWAIVEVGEPSIERKLDSHFVARVKSWNHYHFYADERAMFEATELRVKEKQTVRCGYPLAAGEQDGKLYIYSSKLDSVTDEYEVAFFKTGQEIDVPLDRLRYIGLNRLWIIQELGLYTFIVKKPK